MIKPKSKKRHDADIAAEAEMITAIRGAKYFVASVFVGHGEYVVKSAPTVLRALDAAREIEADPRTHTRRAIISAIGSDNKATMLTQALMQRLLSTPVRNAPSQ